MDYALGFEPIDWMARHKEASANLMAGMQKNAKEAIENARKGVGQCPDPQTYVGRFFHKGYGELEVVPENGGIALRFSRSDMPGYFKGENEFVFASEAMGSALPAVFVRDGSGAVCGVRIPLEGLLPDVPAEFKKI